MPDPKKSGADSADEEPKEPSSDGPKSALPMPDELPDEPNEDSTPFDDAKTADAIDEIVAKEGDEVLAAQDAAAGKGGVKVPAHGGSLKRLWAHKWFRWLMVLVVVGGIVAAGAVPAARYWILNTAGVRSGASVVVVDSTTQLPLKGVEFKVGSKEAVTDSEGRASVKGLKQGPQTVSVTQVGFAEIKRTVTIGWGSNPLGKYALKAVGVQYVIEVTDYLSEKPIEGVEASDGQVTAVSDSKGKITLTLPNTVVAKDAISLTKGGYRSEQISLDADPKKPTKAALVLSQKAVFVARQNGKYDVVKSDIDGKNREVLLAGTGNETSNIALTVSPDGSRAALVSTRDGKRDADGFLQNTLALIEVETGATTTIAQSSQILLIDWVGQRLIFEQVSSDSAATNRYAVISYNYSNNTRLQLATANKLSAVLSTPSGVYYAVPAEAATGTLAAGLYKIGADGNNKQTAFDEEVTTVLRSAYDNLNVQKADNTWYSYKLSNGATTPISLPSSLASRLYIDNADRNRSAWISQGALMSHDVASAKDTTVKNQNGVGYPVRWLTSTALVYRLSVGGEVADYAVSTEGGSARKISDVSPSYGFAQAQ